LIRPNLLDRKTWILSQPFKTVTLIAIPLMTFPPDYQQTTGKSRINKGFGYKN
jgi:hypothetical protein